MFGSRGLGLGGYHEAQAHYLLRVFLGYRDAGDGGTCTHVPAWTVEIVPRDLMRRFVSPPFPYIYHEG